MSTHINDDDLFVVQCGADDQNYNYTGKQLSEDIRQFIASTPDTIKLWIKNSPPPRPGEPDYAGEYDFWYDTSCNCLFLMVETEGSSVNSYAWVMTVPSDKAELYTAPNTDVKFPDGTAWPVAQPFVNPNTGVEYYYKAQRNQWLDTKGGVNKDDFVEVEGDSMTGSLYVPDLYIEDKLLDVTTPTRDLDGPIGGVQEPNTDVDFPGKFVELEFHTNANLEERNALILYLGDRTYKTLRRCQGGVGQLDFTYSYKGDWDDLTGGDWVQEDGAKFPALDGSSMRVSVAKVPEDDKYYIYTASESTGTGCGKCSMLVKANISDVNTQGWEIVNEDCSDFITQAINFDDTRKDRFLHFGFPYTYQGVADNTAKPLHIRFAYVDGTIVTKELPGPTIEYAPYGSNIYSVDGRIYLASKEKIFYSDDDFDTMGEIEAYSKIRSKYPFIYSQIYSFAIYQGLMYVLFNSGDLVAFSDIDDPSTIDHKGKMPNAGDGISPRLRLYHAGDYLMCHNGDATKRTQRPIWFFDGQDFITTNDDIPEDSKYIVVNEETNQVMLVNGTSTDNNNRKYTNKLPASAIPPIPGEPTVPPTGSGGNLVYPYLNFNNDRVALYKELQNAIQDIQLQADGAKELYVEVAGDSMTGPLYMDGVSIVDDNQVVTKEYVDTRGDLYIKREGGNDLTNHSWYIRGPKSSSDSSLWTYISINDGELGLYHVKTPLEDLHAANKHYVDSMIGVHTDDKVKKTGDTMTGPLTIKDINEDHLILNSGSGNNRAFAILGYINDSSATPQNRKAVIEMYASGKIVNTGELINKGGTRIDRVGDGEGTFVVKGTDGSGTEIDLLNSYGNSSDLDAINYRGKTDNGNNIINRNAMVDYVTNVGVQGPTGPTGPTGPNGATGSKGATGTDGVQVIQYNSTTPPSSKPRGTLLMTSNGNLYIYT